MPDYIQTHLIDNQEITPHDKTERLRVFDALRGFSMILVVFAHIMYYFGVGSSTTITGEIFITFRMPLFFFVSGFFAYRAYSYWTTALYKRVFCQKIKAQIICSIIFYALLKFTQNENPLGWTEKGFQGYWFTIVLFQMFTIYALTNIIAHTFRRNISIPITIAIAVVTMALVPLDVLDSSLISTILDTPNLCYFFQFFALGIIVRHYEHRFINLISNNAVKAVLITGFVICLCISHTNLPMERGYIFRQLLPLITSYLGLLMVISLFNSADTFLNKSNFISNSLCFTGRRTLDIYMLHYFFLPSLPVLGAWLAPNSMITFQLIVGLGLATIITAICLLISNCLRSSSVLSDWLFGVRQRTEVYKTGN